MTIVPERLELMGAPGSPYTRKMLAVLRYRRIPHAFLLGSHRNEASDRYPAPKVKLLPTFYFPQEDGSVEAAVDSTPLIRRIENMYDGRSVLPPDPATGFLNSLIEDFADEWLTKAMFHYRWHFDRDYDNGGPLLTFWQDPTLDDHAAKQFAEFIANRQRERLYVVGSNDTTAPIIEDSYKRIVDILDTLIQQQGYVLGARPSSADFALYGQLTQLGIADLTPAEVLAERSMRVRSWIDRMDDLSGLDPQDSDWTSMDDLSASLRPLLNEVGRVYTPFLLANAKAARELAKDFETEIDGRTWAQPTFPYQAKCLQWLREDYASLPAAAREAVDGALKGTGCEPLFT